MYGCLFVFPSPSKNISEGILEKEVNLFADVGLLVSGKNTGTAVQLQTVHRGEKGNH